MSISSRSPSSLAGSQVSPVMSKLMHNSPRQMALSYWSGFQMSGMSLVLSGGRRSDGVVVADDPHRPVAERDRRGVAGVIVAGVVAAAVDRLERACGILVEEAADHVAQAGVLAQERRVVAASRGGRRAVVAPLEVAPAVVEIVELPLDVGHDFRLRHVERLADEPVGMLDGHLRLADRPCRGRRRSTGPCPTCADTGRWRGSPARSSRRRDPTIPNRGDTRRPRRSASGRPRGRPCGRCWQNRARRRSSRRPTAPSRSPWYQIAEHADRGEPAGSRV